MNVTKAEEVLTRILADQRFTVDKEDQLKERFAKRFGRPYDWKKEALAIFDMTKGVEHYLGLDDWEEV